MNVELDLPYICEYSKGRTKMCKKCKDTIEKDEIRLALATPLSKTSNWLHHDCFFQSYRPNGPEEISNFEHMSYADQKMLERSIQESKKRKETDCNDASAFTVEYARSNRSVCRLCDEEIAKCSIRIGKLNRSGLVVSWFHLDCFVSSDLVSKLPYSATDLNNFPLLSNEDQKLLLNKIPIKTKKSKVEETPKEEIFKDDEEETLLKKQSDTYFHYIYNLQELRVTGLESLFRENSIIKNGPYGFAGLGLTERKHFWADALMYGVPQPCPDCGGILVFRISRYVCTGYIDDWTECLYSTEEPMRSEVKIPKNLPPDSFLRDYQYKPGKRIVHSVLKRNLDAKLQEQLSALDAATGFQSDSSSRTGKETIKIKGEAVVSPESGLQEVAHVLRVSNILYSVVLSMVDVVRNQNCYCKLQVLQDDQTCSRHWFFQSSGRIGAQTVQSQVVNCFNQIDAINRFEEMFRSKTGNRWNYRDVFTKKANRYYPVDIDYRIESFDKWNWKSTLHHSVQKLILLLFNCSQIRQSMFEFELDSEKMPLGKLSKVQLVKARATLREISKLISTHPVNQNRLNAVCSKFYTLIPHSFGTGRFPLISTPEAVAQKNEMLDSLMEIELAYEIVCPNAIPMGKDPIDSDYRKLGCHIEALEPTDADFKMIEKYVENTHGHSHGRYVLQIESIFRVSRYTEANNWNISTNRMLLWHGSKLLNYVNILSEGLRIVPPEASTSRRMFGKGIYFADSVSKSANYCFADQTNNQGLLLLCEVSLGNSKEFSHSHNVTELESAFQSVKGIGQYQPDPSATITTADGVKVPLGKLVERKLEPRPSLIYNEYIVYNEKQIKIRYLVNARFEFGLLK